MGQQKHHNEDMILIGLIFLVGGGFIFLIWYFFKVQLKDFVRWVRVGELYLVSWIYGENAAVQFAEYGKQYVSQWREWLSNVEAARITTRDIAASTSLAVTPLRGGFAAVVTFMGLIVLFKAPGTGYRRRMSLETLMKEQAKSFPTIAPFLKFNPSTMSARVQGGAVPSKLPLFAEALSPEEWMAYAEVKVVGGQIDVAAAYRGLAQQLGNRWQSALKMPPYMQGLFAAFALKHVRKRKDSDALLGELALSWSKEKGFNPSSKLMSEVRKIIKNPKIGGVLEKMASQHAYETTAMLRFLNAARNEGGVLAPAQFVWLRAVDRNLWYPLNNLGRKSYHAEAAGAMVHYTNEMIAGQKIPTPRFDEVIKVLQEYMKAPGVRAIPDLDKKAK